MASNGHHHQRRRPPPHTTTTTTKPPPDTRRRRRRRCLCVCVLITLALLLILALTILILSLTLLRVRDPTTRLVSTRLAGVAPRLTLPALDLQLNVTLLLTVAVHNPNAASFAYGADGRTTLLYRGAQVGDASIDPGRVPARGDGNVTLALTVQADKLAQDLTQLIADVESGSVEMEANTVVPGRVTILGIVSRHAVAYSDCTFVLDVAGFKVRSQQCRDRTKL
ncbi:hypothetical protein U9M48_005490 [Paspalum notatum var. saurae]|uniref:Late embryogenesis abundant protein LEA-2 subgroup domain-containing protein n=1 Tax=Paspalum notatum var. saurae TaxID=547442 RepID=A0AAQ3SIL0_PASNO